MRKSLFAAAAVLVLSAGAAHAQSDWYRWKGDACAGTDVEAVRKVSIKTELYDRSFMISPDSAKVVALCAVPGQIGSGKMKVIDKRTVYSIDIIPNHKQTHTEVVVDARTGYVLSSKQFGGLAGKVGWLHQSFDHKENAKP
jgi:uncharacterized membrane protein YkoI